MPYCIDQKVELIRASLNPYSPLSKSGSASSGGRIRKGAQSSRQTQPGSRVELRLDFRCQEALPLHPSAFVQCPNYKIIHSGHIVNNSYGQ